MYAEVAKRKVGNPVAAFPYHRSQDWDYEVARGARAEPLRASPPGALSSKNRTSHGRDGTVKKSESGPLGQVVVSTEADGVDVRGELQRSLRRQAPPPLRSGRPERRCSEKP